MPPVSGCDHPPVTVEGGIESHSHLIGTPDIRVPRLRCVGSPRDLSDAGLIQHPASSIDLGQAALHSQAREVNVDRIADFLFEVGMLKKTPRSGWQFLAGAARESVAEHSFRVTMIAFVLSRLHDTPVDANRVVDLALIHDLAEARTGDLNYMNQKYAHADEARAEADLAEGLPFARELEGLLREYRDAATPEAVLAHDADQLEMLTTLVEQRDAGVPSTEHWTPFVIRRLRTETARSLARAVLDGDSAGWWFDRSSSWWVRGGKG
jgi:putative hydrolase of HD superfamily